MVVGARALRRVVGVVLGGREGAEVGAPLVPPHEARATPRGLVRQPSHLLLTVCTMLFVSKSVTGKTSSIAAHLIRPWSQ